MPTDPSLENSDTNIITSVNSLIHHIYSTMSQEEATALLLEMFEPEPLAIVLTEIIAQSFPGYRPLIDNQAIP